MQDKDIWTWEEMGQGCHGIRHRENTITDRRNTGHAAGRNDLVSAPEPKAQVHYCAYYGWPSSLFFHICDFFSGTHWNHWTKLDRKQDLNVLYQACVYQANQKTKMAALPGWPLIGWDIFQLFLWNCWTEFSETWQEARSQSLLPSLCLSGQSENQDGCPGLWLAETFFNFFSETAEQNSAKLDRRQNLKVFYQVCVYRADQKTKMAALASDWLRHFSTFSLKLLNRIQRNLTGSKISKSSTKFVFIGPIRKLRWPPWPLIGWDIFDFFSETADRIFTKLDGRQVLNIIIIISMYFIPKRGTQVHDCGPVCCVYVD